MLKLNETRLEPKDLNDLIGPQTWLGQAAELGWTVTTTAIRTSRRMEVLDETGAQTDEVRWYESAIAWILLSNLRGTSTQSQRLCIFTLGWEIRGFSFIPASDLFGYVGEPSRCATENGCSQDKADYHIMESSNICAFGGKNAENRQQFRKADPMVKSGRRLGTFLWGVGGQGNPPEKTSCIDSLFEPSISQDNAHPHRAKIVARTLVGHDHIVLRNSIGFRIHWITWK